MPLMKPNIRTVAEIHFRMAPPGEGLVRPYGILTLVAEANQVIGQVA